MKIKRLIKKILRTILIWSTICLIAVVPVYAEFIVTTSNPPNYFVGQWWIDPYVTSKWQIKVNTYDEDQQPPYSGYVSTAHENYTSQGVIGFWLSKLEPDTYYHFTMSLEFEDSTGIETGNMLKSATQFMAIEPDQTFVRLPTIGDNTSFPIDPLTPLPAQYYDMFYDKTSKILSAVFYIPETWAEENREAMMHSYIVISLGSNAKTVGNTVVTGRKTINAQGIYTDVLKDIRNYLSRLSETAGTGLTQDQVTEAVEQALADHDQKQMEYADQVLGEGGALINEAVGQYITAVDDIRKSLSGISDALSYKGTDGVLVLPEARNPMSDNALLWPRQEIDLVAAWNGIPQALRTVVSIVLTLAILTSIIREVMDVLETWNMEKEMTGG